MTKYAEVKILSTPDVFSLKLHQLDQALIHLAGDKLVDYIDGWIAATRELVADRLGPVRDFTPPKESW
jgi:hypothetical protein